VLNPRVPHGQVESSILEFNQLRIRERNAQIGNRVQFYTLVHAIRIKRVESDLTSFEGFSNKKQKTKNKKMFAPSHQIKRGCVATAGSTRS
jgi:hypothetical protein